MKRLGTKSPLIREALFKTLETKKLVKEADDNYDLLCMPFLLEYLLASPRW